VTNAGQKKSFSWPGELVLYANDEVAKSGRTGITTAYIYIMIYYWGCAFSGENHGLHNALLTRR